MVKLNKCCCLLNEGFHYSKNDHKAFSCYSDYLVSMFTLFYKSLKFVETVLLPLKSNSHLPKNAICFNESTLKMMKKCFLF